MKAKAITLDLNAKNSELLAENRRLHVRLAKLTADKISLTKENAVLKRQLKKSSTPDLAEKLR
jgi:hypothetical protein